MYYVYAYINKKTGLPYYIGKGKGDRYKGKHNVTIPKDKTKIVFLETNLSNIGACALERRYIRWYGRKTIDENGILYNIAEGGDGNGSPEAAKKAWETRRKNGTDKGVRGAYGPQKNPKKQLSEEHKAALRRPRPQSRKPNGPQKNPSNKITCEYCNVTTNPGNITRHHGDKCKHKLINIKKYKYNK
jgi:hypothetical protein